MNVGRDHLAATVTRRHSVPSRWIETVHVDERHEGKVVWQGEIEVFALEGHAKAVLCYAWAEPPHKEGQKPRVYAVLKTPPVASAADAVKAFIVARRMEKDV